MFEQNRDDQPTSATAARAEPRSGDREPFVPPTVTDLGRMNDLTLLGGSL